MCKYICALLAMIILAGCGEYNKALKSRDPDYKFDFARRAYDKGNYPQASSVLSDIVNQLRGTQKGEEALYLLAMSYFQSKDYMNSGAYFKSYYNRYPKGKYTEDARYFSGYGYYLESPDSQLDQTVTLKGIEELQKFLEYFPKSERVPQVQNAIFELQDKLTLKELQNAQLYYNLGTYRGNNYASAVIVAQNALKAYPYTKYREQLEMIVLKSKFQEAENSVAEKKEDRYRDVLDEYYSFVNNYPDTKNRQEADNIARIARRHVKE